MIKKLVIGGVIVAVAAAAILYFIPWGEYESKIEKSEVQVEEAIDSTGQVIPTLSTITGNFEIASGKNVQAEILFHVEGLKKTKGAFEEFSIEFNVPEDYTQSSLTVNIASKSINTNNGMRDEHLMEADFFDVENYPEIVFKSTSVSQSDTAYIAHGELTLLEETKTLDVPFKHLGGGENEEGEHFEAFEGKFIFDRIEYGMEEVTGAGNVVTVEFYCELFGGTSSPAIEDVANGE